MGLSRLVVRAVADPETLPRMVNHFAKLGITPCRVRSDEENGTMTIQIEQDGVDEGKLLIVAENMRSSILVESVQLTYDWN